MRCPVCGAKMINDGSICRYCSDVTIDRIKSSSNKLAKKARKEGRGEEVVYTNYIPTDVNRNKLLLLTIFLGIFGAHDLYVGKRWKGLFSLLSVTLMLVFSVLRFVSQSYGWGLEDGLVQLLSIFYFLVVIVLVLWFSDVINVLSKRYKVPVILGDKKI